MNIESSFLNTSNLDALSEFEKRPIRDAPMKVKNFISETTITAS